jgi:hypothetical protein
MALAAPAEVAMVTHQSRWRALGIVIGRVMIRGPEITFTELVIALA